jgi:hypothetical protein
VDVKNQEGSMTRPRTVLIASVVVVALGAVPVAAQELSRYREFTLDSGMASVLATSGARADETKTLHERPARIQQLDWRLPYDQMGGELDPVRGMRFTFYDGRLYQVVVSYHRDRTKGLTDDDVVGSLSATYGVPLLPSRMTSSDQPAAGSSGVMVVARWDDGVSMMTLTRATSWRELELTLVSKALHALAHDAIGEALRLDEQEAPQRKIDDRLRAVADRDAANEKSRLVNRAAFRP